MADRERVIQDIVDLELEMFLAVPADGIYSCQQNPDAFRLHRSVQFTIWSDDTLNFYQNDLQAARSKGLNLMTVKYARMENRIPSADPNPLIEDIVAIQMRWQAEMIRKYPGIMAGGRPLSQAADDERLTSFETYHRGELETYSGKTLDSYFRDVTEAVGAGRNLIEERHTYIFRESGYDSIDDVENERKQAQQA